MTKKVIKRNKAVSSICDVEKKKVIKKTKNSSLSYGQVEELYEDGTINAYNFYLQKKRLNLNDKKIKFLKIKKLNYFKLLDISGNLLSSFDFEGSLSKNLLTYLDVSNNKGLNHDIEVLKDFINLRYLDISFTEFHGDIDSFRNIGLLSNLYINNTKCFGSLRSLSSELIFISLHNTYIEPSFEFLSSKVKYIVFFENNITLKKKFPINLVISSLCHNFILSKSSSRFINPEGGFYFVEKGKKIFKGKHSKASHKLLDTANFVIDVNLWKRNNSQLLKVAEMITFNDLNHNLDPFKIYRDSYYNNLINIKKKFLIFDSISDLRNAVYVKDYEEFNLCFCKSKKMVIRSYNWESQEMEDLNVFNVEKEKNHLEIKDKEFEESKEELMIEDVCFLDFYNFQTFY